MNFRSVNDFRDKRNQFVNMPYVPMHYSIASYCTDSHKEEMRATFGDEFLTTLPMVPDPLKKNLADSIITTEASVNRKTKNSLEQNNMGRSISLDRPDGQMVERSESYAFSGITNFISGVFNVISGAMFQKRPKSPANQHYDNFNYADDRKRSPGDGWQASKIEDQNISRRAQEQNGEKEMYKTNMMNNDYGSTVTTCREKLNQVRMLLKPVPKVNKYRSNRPKKKFVEPGSYEEVFEDAFTPEDFVALANQSILKHRSPVTHHKPVLLETAAPKLRTYLTPVGSKFSKATQKGQKNGNKGDAKVSGKTAPEVVVKKPLKSILKNGPKPKPEIQEANVPKVHDKHHKNPHRTTVKRKKMHQKQRIQEDLLFADEIESDCISSVESSPKIKRGVQSDLESTTDSFDEVSGRFRNVSTTESDDSFQIVFTEDTPPTRSRKVSECDSEDSFIVFEDPPGSCYTSTDVFGDDGSDSGSESDCESDLSDSGCSVSKLCKLKANLSRTISDLTDDSLYENVCKCTSEDEVDCAFKSVVELSSEQIQGDQKATVTPKPVAEEKVVKRVHFSTDPPKVRVMRVWAFAARQARVGRWERDGLDRTRFKRRIADVEMAVSWVLKPQHRSRVMFQRFMPWWNAQRRKEIAEKKQKAEEARLLAEEEQRIKEELEKLEAEAALAENSELNGLISNDEGMDSNASAIVEELSVNGIDSTDIKDTIEIAEPLNNNVNVTVNNVVTTVNENNINDCPKVLDIDCVSYNNNNNVNSISTSNPNTSQDLSNDNTVNNNILNQVNGSPKDDAHNSSVTPNLSINNEDAAKKCPEKENAATTDKDLVVLDKAETKIEKICDKLTDLKITNGISLNLSGT